MLWLHTKIKFTGKELASISCTKGGQLSGPKHAFLKSVTKDLNVNRSERSNVANII